MRLKVKTEETGSSRTFGIVETFRVSEGYSKKTIEGIAVLDVALGTLAEPFFYFANSFISIEDASTDLGAADATQEQKFHNDEFTIGLTRYMKARKPVHSLFGNNKPIVQFGATRQADGTYTTFVTVLKPIRSLVSEDTIIVSRLKNSVPFTQGMREQLIYILENTESRTDYYKVRQHLFGQIFDKANAKAAS